MKMANLCHLLTKMMPVSSHQNKHHVSRSNLPTPRELLPALPYFSDIMAQPAQSVCPIALETTTSSEVSLAEWRFCFRNSPACQCYHLTLYWEKIKFDEFMDDDTCVKLNTININILLALSL